MSRFFNIARIGWLIMSAAFLLSLGPMFADGQAQTTETPWEAIRPDYSNIRGLNYIASYAPSDVAMWRFYDREQIDRELGLIKGLGTNSIRVWLAWVVYDVEGDKFTDKFIDFLGLCDKHRLTVMPILWDSCFGDELSDYEDIRDWVANPGTRRVSDPVFREKGDAYVRAVVSAGSGSPSILMWDIMNEPSGPNVNPWLEHYCKLVKSIDPKHPVTIGWAHASGNEVSAQWVDVMSYHPYGIFDKNRQIWTDRVLRIARACGNKPILATEAGGPGLGQRYEECIASFDKLGVGFYLFEAMVGKNRFSNITGFFYPDGTPREAGPVDAFQSLARRQGATPTATIPRPSRQPPYPIMDVKAITDLILHWDDRELTAESYAETEPFLTWTFISLAWAGVLDDQIQHVMDLKGQVETAARAGDLDEVKQLTSQLASLAAKLLVQHKFVVADATGMNGYGKSHCCRDAGSSRTAGRW